jgi:translocation and assembly module TamA
VKHAYLFILILLCCASFAFSQDLKGVEVAVTGLADPLLGNVLASLSLKQELDNPILTDTAVQRLFSKAEQEIRSALQPYGYYSPVVSKSLTREDDIWRARFDIDPGEPVRITELTLRLAGAGRDDRALTESVSRFPLHAGDILDHRLYEEGKKRLTSTALTAGYRDVAFTGRTVEVNPAQYSAAVLLVLDTGPQYYFGETSFAADFINHDFLQRLLPYKEGEPFSPKVLVELRQALLGSEYFSNVEVTTGDPSPESRKVPVLVSLSPRKPNKYSFGIGYGTDTGTRGSVEWTSRLFNRYGHQVSVQLQPSERKNLFGGVYTIPIRDPRKDRLALLAKYENEYFENTETEQRTVSLSYDHVLKNGEYSLYLAYLDEDYDTGLDTGHATLLTPGIKTTWRLADNRLKAQRGVLFTLNLTGADRNVFSDTTFLQGSVSAKAIFAFLDGWRVIGRCQLGGTMVDNIYDLPPLLRFYAGGDQSVRGYAYKSIGPQDALGNVLGGRYLATYSVEVERTLVESWSAALFFDSGDAFNSLPDVAMQHGGGVGIRWELPFGQVRLDLAKALNGDGDWRIHFTVGADL